jgi:hypothetical protein
MQKLQMDAHITAMQPAPQPRPAAGDRLIDHKYGLLDLYGQLAYTSEPLYAVDAKRYHDTIRNIENGAEDEDPS